MTVSGLAAEGLSPNFESSWIAAEGVSPQFTAVLGTDTELRFAINPVILKILFEIQLQRYEESSIRQAKNPRNFQSINVNF
jgi:hypothetical protein